MSGTGAQTDFTFHHLGCEGFRRYPWFSSADLDMLSTGSGVAALEKLVETLAKSNIFRPYHTDDRFIMTKFDILLEPLDITYPQNHSTTHREYIFALFLLRYRVLDIGLWLWRHSGSKTPSDRIMRTSLPDTQGITRFKKLHDWLGLVRSARDLCANPREVISVAGQGFTSARLKHACLYIRRTEQHRQEDIFVNFDTAALYLSHLLEGFPDLNKSNAPPTLLDQLNKEPSVPLRGIKVPLHLALTVSPLALLIPTNHVNAACGRPQMIEIWQALGSERPEHIQTAERELWQALFDLSLSPILDTRERLLSALDNILFAVGHVPPKRDDLVFFYANPTESVRSIPNKASTSVAVAERPRVAREEEEEEEEEEGRERDDDKEILPLSAHAHPHPFDIGIGPGYAKAHDISSNDEMAVDQDALVCNTNGRPEDGTTDSEMEESLTLGMAGEIDKEIGDKMDDDRDTPAPVVVERSEIGIEVVVVEKGYLQSPVSGGDGKPSKGDSVGVPGDGGMNISQDIQISGIDDEHTVSSTAMDGEGGYLSGGLRDENEGDENTFPSPTSTTSTLTVEDSETESETEPDENSSGVPVNDMDGSRKVERDTTSLPSTVPAITSTASSRNKPAKGQFPPERQSARIANKLPVPAPPNPAPLRPAPKPKKKASLTQTKAPRQESGSRAINKKPLETMKDVEDSLTPETLSLPSITIQTVETQLRVTASVPSRLYGCMGLDDFLDYTPSFHYEENLHWFQKVISAVQQSYSGGYPLHLTDPENSSIRILDFATFSSLSPEDMQSIFKKQHIVVHGYPCRPAAFDEKAMRYLAPSSKPITIHDMSVLPQSNDGNERHEIGLTGDLLKSHRSPNGKILNALDFPMPGCGIRPPETLATDILAFHETLEDPYYSRSTPPPLSDLYWGLAATNHSFHYFHIDADGFATNLAAQTGAKYWIVARPKAGKSFAATDMYTDGDYAIDEMNTELWDIEAILLTPGTCLFMKPNTPHLVLTPQASICYGGHFYASSTLRPTCHGILHTFVACSLLTNTEHTDGSRELLRRLLRFYFKAFQSDYAVDGPTGKAISPQYKGDIPDIFTFDGLLDVLSLCNLMELGNIIHYKTYTDDGMTQSERRRMITGRVFSRLVRNWLEANVEIHHPHDRLSLASLEQDVFYPYLASQVAALLSYKKRAPKSGAQGHVEFTLQGLERQINRTFVDDSRFQACYHPETDPKTFDWTGTAYQVLPAEGDKKPMPVDDDGLTFDDREWLKKRKAPSNAEEEMAVHPPKRRARV